MQKEIIALLKSDNPKDRARGIKQLAASDHPDTLKILSAMYKKETHPSVKKLAAQVAREIKENTVEDDFASVSDPVIPSNTKRDPEQAKAHLERAMSAVIDLKNDEAWEWARKAFIANPDYADDDYAMGLASEITGADRSVAVAELMRTGTTAAPEKAKRDAGDRISWGKALLGVGIYSLLVGIATYVPFAFLGDLILFLIEFGDTTGEFAELGITPAQLSTSFGIVGIIVGISAIIMTFIGVLIQYGFVHISSTMILGGKGYFSNLLYNLRIPLISIFVLQVVLSGIMFYTIFSSIPTDPAVWEAAEISGDYSAFEDVEANLGLINILSGINGLMSLGFTVWISIIIGNTYDFGGVKGCLSIIISSIIMGVVLCGCYFTVLSTVFAGFSGLSQLQ